MDRAQSRRAKLRWKGKTKAEKRAHSLLMNRARWGKAPRRKRTKRAA